MIVYRYPADAGTRVPPWLERCRQLDDDDRQVAHRASHGGTLVALTADGLVRPPPDDVDWHDCGEHAGVRYEAAVSGDPFDPPPHRRGLIHPVRVVPGATGLAWALPVLYDPAGGYAFPRELIRDPESGTYAQMVPEWLRPVTSIAQIVRESILEGSYDDMRVTVAAECAEQLLAHANHIPRCLIGTHLLPLDEAIIDAALITAAAAEGLMDELEQQTEAGA